MPLLFLSSAILYVAFGIADRWFWSSVGSVFDGLPSFFRSAAVLLAALPELVVDACVLAPVAVVIHRFVILEETSRGFSVLRQACVRRFAIWTFCVQFVLLIVDVMTHRGDSGFFHFLGYVALIILFARTLLIFPAIAIDVPSASAADRIEASLSSSRGLFWSTVIGLIIVAVPLMLTGIAPALAEALIGKLHAMSPNWIAAAQFDGGFLTATLNDFLHPFALGVIAALASWLYLWAQEYPFQASEPSRLPPPN
jgi:hypothetical protein